jgi:hypothetical protein
MNRKKEFVRRTTIVMMGRLSWIVAIVVGLTASASAEVMDKVVPLEELQIGGLIGVVACGIAAWFWPKALWLLLPVSLYFCLGVLGEVTDPYVGRAILDEAGPSYVWTARLFPVVLIVVTALCLRWRLVAFRNKQPLKPDAPTSS